MTDPSASHHQCRTPWAVRRYCDWVIEDYQWFSSMRKVPQAQQATKVQPPSRLTSQGPAIGPVKNQEWVEAVAWASSGKKPGQAVPHIELAQLNLAESKLSKPTADVPKYSKPILLQPFVKVNAEPHIKSTHPPASSTPAVTCHYSHQFNTYSKSPSVTGRERFNGKSIFQAGSSARYPKPSIKKSPDEHVKICKKPDPETRSTDFKPPKPRRQRQKQALTGLPASLTSKPSFPLHKQLASASCATNELELKFPSKAITNRQAQCPSLSPKTPQSTKPLLTVSKNTKPFDAKKTFPVNANTFTFVSWNGTIKRRLNKSPRLSDRPPPRRVERLPDASCYLLNLPWEVRRIILEYIYDSALVVMSTVELFGRDLVGRFIASTSPYNSNGIPSNVFPCLAYVDRTNMVQLELPETWWGERFHYRNLPVERGFWGGKHNARYQGSPYLHSGLLFTCRQLAYEFAPILYSRTALAFGSTRALRKFLSGQDRLANELLCKYGHAIGSDDVFALGITSHITNICLEMKEYGEPVEERHCVSRYYTSWRACCRRLVEQLSNLKHVAISAVVPTNLQYRDKKQLQLDDEWVAPMLEFERSKSLESAGVTLLMTDFSGQTISRDICTAFSEIIRRRMLGWSDVDALEAIEDFKSQPWTSRLTTWDAWSMFARANGAT